MSSKIISITALVLGFASLGLAGVACGSVNKSITIGPGTETGGQSTVNGGISVGRSAIVNGSLETVNGQITLDDQARARDVETVNGSIRLGEGVTADDLETVNGSIRVGAGGMIEGSVSAVNGKINSQRGTRVAGDISNVNGEIEIRGTEIGGDLTTTNGDILLTDNSVLQGNLTIDEPSGWNWSGRKSRKPRVIIGPGTQILGEVRLEREVELYISDSASIGRVSGKMSSDDAVRFSGEHP